MIPAPVEDVWDLVRDFDGLPGWHPSIEASRIADGRPASEVGCVRELTLADGARVDERLLRLDDLEHSYTYTFVSSPFDVRSYVCTLALDPVTATRETFARWWTDFDTDAESEDELRRTFADDVFAVGLAALRARFG